MVTYVFFSSQYCVFVLFLELFEEGIQILTDVLAMLSQRCGSQIETTFPAVNALARDGVHH